MSIFMGAGIRSQRNDHFANGKPTSVVIFPQTNPCLTWVSHVVRHRHPHLAVPGMAAHTVLEGLLVLVNHCLAWSQGNKSMLINISTEHLKWRSMIQQTRKSMLHQTMHVHVASDTQTIRCFDRSKWRISLRNFPPFFRPNVVSDGLTDSHRLWKSQLFRTIRWSWLRVWRWPSEVKEDGNENLFS